MGQGSVLAVAQTLAITTQGDTSLAPAKTVDAVQAAAQVSATNVAIKAAAVYIRPGASLAATGDVTTGSGDITITASAAATLEGNVSARDALTVTGADVVTNGQLFGNTVGLTSTAGTVWTRGSVSALDGITLSAAKAFTNEGLIEAQKTIAIHAAAISNPKAGTIRTVYLTLTASTPVVTDLAWIGNSGVIDAADTLRVTGGSLVNHLGGLIDAGALRFTLSRDFLNEGTVKAYDLLGEATKAVSLSGLVDVKAYFGVKSETLSVQPGGRILGGPHVYAETTGKIVLGSGSLISGDDIDLRGGSVESWGEIRGQDVVTLVAKTGGIGNFGTITGKTLALPLRKSDSLS